MKNVLKLSKLFLVSALVLPLGQVFGMKKVVEVTAKGTVKELKIEFAKESFWQRPIVKGVVWGGFGFTGAAFYNTLMRVCNKEKRSLSKTGIAVSTLVPGVFGYIRGMVASNGKKIDQVLENQKNSAIYLKAFRRLVQQDMQKLDERNGKRTETLQKNQQTLRDGQYSIATALKVNLTQKELAKLDLDTWFSDNENKKRLNEMVQKIFKEEENKKKKNWSWLKPWTWV